jgi:signal transduction histidine kinase
MPLFRSLKSRLAWGLSAALVAVLVIGGVTIFSVVEHRLRSQFDHGLTDKLRFFEASCIEKENGNIALSMLRDDWESLDDPSDPDFFQIRFSNGKLIYRSQNLQGADLPRDGLASFSARTGEASLPAETPGRFASLTFYPRMSNGGEVSEERSTQAVNVTVAHNSGMLAAATSELKAVLGSVGAILAFVILGVTWLLTHTGLRPLGRLRSQIDTIPLGQTERFDSDGMPSELTPIVTKLNTLMDRVGTTLQHEREFTANVAHELRTPMAVLRAQLESLLRFEPLSHQTEDKIRETLSTQAELESSVENLLWLARLDRGLDRFEEEEVEVGRFLRTCWKPFLDAADAKGLQIEWNLRHAPRVACSPDLLRVLLRNLYENAVAYTPSDGKISISGSTGSSPVTIAVTNTCDGLDKDQLETLFARRDRQPQRPFTSRTAARSLADPARLGIGLALSRRVAGVLGGELNATLKGRNQVEFRLELNSGQNPLSKN